MKKILVLGLILLFGSSFLAAQGVAHPCYLEVFYSDGVTHPDFDTELVSVIATNVTGGGAPLTGPPWEPSIVYYDNSFHLVCFQAGTFVPPWLTGDVVTVWVQCTSPTFGTESATFTGTLSDAAGYEYWAGTEGLTLPVELSAFTATFMDSYTLIRWVTASETDVNGFNIYRGTDDEYGSSEKINIQLIPGYGTTSEPQYYEFQDIDQLIYETTYYYWLESVNLGGSSNVYGSIEYTPEIGQGGFEDDFDNNQLMNQPNPFSSTTTISYAIKGMLKSEPVNISIYNTLGQLILTDVAKNGVYQFDASDLPTGVYFYRLETESYNNIKKMMIIR